MLKFLSHAYTVNVLGSSVVAEAVVPPASVPLAAPASFDAELPLLLLPHPATIEATIADTSIAEITFFFIFFFPP